MDALDLQFGRFVLDVAVKTTALLAVTGVALLALHKASAATRHLVAVAGLAGALAIPALASFLPAWDLPVLPGERRSLAEGSWDARKLGSGIPPGPRSSSRRRSRSRLACRRSRACASRHRRPRSSRRHCLGSNHLGGISALALAGSSSDSPAYAAPPCAPQFLLAKDGRFPTSARAGRSAFAASSASA